jgi:hypothetical protein
MYHPESTEKTEKIQTTVDKPRRRGSNILRIARRRRILCRQPEIARRRPGSCAGARHSAPAPVALITSYAPIPLVENLLVDQNRRPSIYLQERAEDLARVLDFFTAPHRGQAPGYKEMLIIFLSQLGFWEWELDNLIYAFTTFEERATAWEHENGFGIANALRTKGIWVQTAAAKKIKIRRQARSGHRRVFAPVASLNKLISQWNDLLRFCEEGVLIPPKEREIALQSGAQLMPDLSKYRKAPLPE